MKSNNYMTKNNMIFLKGSYGTIVNEDFDVFFKLSDALRPYRELWERGNYYIDHKNLLYSKDYKLHVLTSSPYTNVFNVKHNVPNCKIFLINPLFLDYTGFNGDRNIGCNLAYVYDKYLDKFKELADELKEYYNMEVFVKIGG